MQARRLVEISKRRFQVPGVQSQTTDESQSVPKEADLKNAFEPTSKAGTHVPDSE
jgi:hypothetical protein